jgi:hypothetical protein
VEGVYDRFKFQPQKDAALQNLANLIDRIINPPPSVVVPIRKRRRR